METGDPRLEPGRKVAHYVIRAFLGEGGMGTIYLADDLTLRRKVALKVLPAGPAGDGTARKRLLLEARAAAGLDHPNICAIYEVGEDGGLPYVAMQYVEGETLDARLRRGPLSEDEALEIAIRVADALGAAHLRKIVHRDIKPSNVMLTPRGEVKILGQGAGAALMSARFPSCRNPVTATPWNQTSRAEAALAGLAVHRQRLVRDPLRRECRVQAV